MSPHIQIDTLILSDLHLGSPIGKPQLVKSLLTAHSFKRLILLGDIFDYHAHYDRLNSANTELLKLLKEYSEKEGREIVWIRGNHDHNRNGDLARFIGAPILDQYSWKHGDKNFLAIHGDQFDSFLSEQGIIDRLAHGFFLQVQKLDRKGRHIVKLIDYANAKVRRLPSKIARGAIRHAMQNNAHYIFCGHTHIATQLVHSNGVSTVNYFNTGCWTHTPTTFAVVDTRGNVLLEKFQ